MDVEKRINELADKARFAAGELRKLTTEEKNAVLLEIAAELEKNRAAIEVANAADCAAGAAAGLTAAFIDRLTLTPARFDAMVSGVRDVVKLPDPVGTVLERRTRPSGITIEKIREPLGVIAVVFESRPNVFIDTAALCLKSGNAIILRGGKEAIRSNTALAEAVSTALASVSARVGKDVTQAVQFVDFTDHAAVRALVRAVGKIDVAIPRGGERLIRAMCEAALIPVLKHYKGVCHEYVDEKADLAMALAILDNAKCQRPSACNAVECLLLHEKVAPLFIRMVEAWAKDRQVTLHFPEAVADWSAEFLAFELNIGIVKNVTEAIRHINNYGSHHSDCIVTQDEAAAAEFLRDVDSACVYHNVSTRFTDGAEFGLGAEIGISTDKLHARGPMGLEELTTYKYRVTGDGIIRK